MDRAHLSGLNGFNYKHKIEIEPGVMPTDMEQHPATPLPMEGGYLGKIHLQFTPRDAGPLKPAEIELGQADIEVVATKTNNHLHPLLAIQKEARYPRSTEKSNNDLHPLLAIQKEARNPKNPKKPRSEEQQKANILGRDGREKRALNNHKPHKKTKNSHQKQDPLNLKPVNKTAAIKYSWHLEGYLWGQSIKVYYVTSHFQNAVDQLTIIAATSLLMTGIYYYDSDTSRLCLALTFVVYIAKSVLSLIDVFFILCVNHRKRENPIIILSVFANISFYSFQFLAAIREYPVRDNILLINSVYYGVYAFLAILAKCTEPKASREAKLGVNEIRVSATDYYCYAALLGYTVEYLYTIKLLGALKWSWMWVLYPVPLMLGGMILFVVFACCFGVLEFLRSGDEDSLSIFMMPLVPAVFFLPVVFWVHFLNEFERSYRYRNYLLSLLGVFLFGYTIYAMCTIKFRQYVANSDIREAIVNHQEIFNEKNPKKRPRKFKKQKSGLFKSKMEAIGSRLKKWNLSGNFFKKQKSGIEALSRKKKIDRKKTERKRRRRRQREEEQALCAICFEKKPDTVFLPCKHGGFCAQCALEIFQKNRKCPLCRKRLDRIVVFEKKEGRLVKKFDIR